MKHEISYKKMSKKKQRDIDNEQRKYWPIDPVTKIIENKKKYFTYDIKEDTHID